MKRKRFSAIAVAIMFFIQILPGVLPAKIVKAAEITEFPFITGVSIKDANGNELGDNVDKSSEIHIYYTWSIINDEHVNPGDFYQMQLPNQINIVAAIDQPINDSNGEKIADMHIGTDGKITITFTQYASENSNVNGNFFIDCFFKESEIDNKNPVPIDFVIPGMSDPITVDVNFQQPDPTIVKSGSYDPLTDEITWTIMVNEEGVRLNNAIVEDIIKSGQVFVDNSVTINGSMAVPGTDYTYDSTSKNLSVNLGDITSQQVISFKTSVKEDLATKPQGSYNYNNEALLKYEDKGDPKSTTSNAETIPVSVSYISKNGTYDPINKVINWTIKVNESGRTINNAVITDSIPEGLTLIDGTVKLNGQDKVKDIDYTISGQDFTYDLGNINSMETITFSTAVDPDVYNSNNSQNYNNTAILSGDGVPSGTSSSIGVGVTTNIIQKQGYGYDAATGIITWKITVNNNKTKVAAGAVVTDNIPIGQIYVPGSAKLDGKPLDDSLYTAADSGDTTKTGTFAYTFASEFSDTHTITLQTKVTDPEHYMANYDGYYYNTVNLTAEGINQNTTGYQPVTSEIINKTGIGYNYVTREISWEIVVNKNKMPITNAVVTDYIPIGQEYVENSASIDNGAPISGFSYTAAEEDDTAKTGTLIYTFPQGSSNKINDTYTIAFKTKVTDLSIFNTSGDKILNNTASITGDEIPTDGDRSSTGTQIIENEVVNKTSDYTFGNSYIDWTVEANGNFSIPMSGVTITDVLQEGLSLDTDTVELYKATINPDDGSLVQGEKVTLNGDSVKYNSDTREFVFTFPEDSGTGAFMLKFRTDVSKIDNYTNSIEFKGTLIEESNTSETVGVWYSTGGGSGTGENGSITVTKVDSKSDTKKLQGAVFQLLDQYGNVKATSEPTGADGSVVFDKLKFDINYSVKEITPPTGYNLSEEIYTFQIHNASDQKNITYKYKDDIVKGTIEFTKTGENDKALQGAEFSLYKDSDTNFQTPIATAISGSDGKVQFKDVEYGSYNIKETKAPEGYNLSSEVLKATINEDGKTVNPDKAEINNTKIHGGIEITKTDASTFAPLPGATITVYTSDGKPVGDGAQGETKEDGTVEFNNLPYGDYYFVETNAPEGYVLNSEKHPFSIKENGVIIKGSLTNIRITGGINITKTDASTYAPVPGATIAIYTSDGKPVGNGLQGKTGEDGTLEFNNLPYGDYYFLETSAPEGYLLNTDKHPFSIKENGVIIQDTFTNAKIKGTVEVKKNGEDGNYLADTEFTLFDSNGNVVQKAVTDNSGIAKFIDVEYGNYTVKETRAPKGYTISDKELSVNVNGTEDGMTYDAGTITDAKIRASILIKKVDQDRNPLQGAEFTLYDTEGNVLQTAVSDEDGSASFKDIVYGSYLVKETKVPEGYTASTDEIEVAVVEDGATYFYEIENTRIKGTIEISKTDTDGNALQGAEFTLYDKDEKAIATAISGDDGIARFEAVDYGTYTIKETKAPKGYILNDKVLNVKIDSAETQKFTVQNEKEKNSLDMSNLPQTGQLTNPIIFVITGVLSLIVAIVSVFLKKKRSI